MATSVLKKLMDGVKAEVENLFPTATVTIKRVPDLTETDIPVFLIAASKEENPKSGTNKSFDVAFGVDIYHIYSSATAMDDAFLIREKLLKRFENFTPQWGAWRVEVEPGEIDQAWQALEASGVFYSAITLRLFSRLPADSEAPPPIYLGLLSGGRLALLGD